MLLKANDTSPIAVVEREDPKKVDLSQLVDLAIHNNISMIIHSFQIST